MKKSLITVLTIVALIAVANLLVSADSLEPQKKKKARLEEKTSRAESEARNVAYLVKEVRKELVTLPYFSVFDWLEGNVEPDGTVYLRGQVTRPTLKSDAENRVEKVEGVEKVVNQIEVLPLSPNDDRLRAAVFRTLFNSGSPLFRYGQQAVPPIHIIVKNGRLTMKGIVANKGDSDIANIRANSVSGLFEVRNELRVEGPTKKR